MKSVRLVISDPIGNPIADITVKPGERINLGAGVTSNMMAVGYIEVLNPIDVSRETKPELKQRLDDYWENPR